MTTAGAIDAGIEAAVRRDQLVAGAGLAIVVAVAWAYLLVGAGMGHTAMTAPMAWTPGYAVMMFSMWWIMMVAMMVPGAAPLVLLVAAIQRRRQPEDRLRPAAALALAGYLAVWGAFSLAATLAQWGLERSWLVSPAGMTAGATLAAAILIAAGLYQLTPLKDACLQHCRSPLAFVTGHWRPGPAGAFRMGLVHGAYCLGCCWFLMGLLFIGGIMNPLWIGGIALYVLLEKFAPRGHQLRRATGIALVVAGFVLIFRAV